MSTDENHNNNEHIISNSNIDKSINILNNDSEIKEIPILSHEQKLKELKKKLALLLKNSLGKSLLNLESNTQNQLKVLTVTAKLYKDFDNKIKSMENQLEENLKKIEEDRKLKKIKEKEKNFFLYPVVQHKKKRNKNKKKDKKNNINKNNINEINIINSEKS